MKTNQRWAMLALIGALCVYSIGCSSSETAPVVRPTPGDVCLPTTAAAQKPIALEFRQNCGTVCGESDLTCKVTVTGSTVLLETTVLQRPFEGACITICVLRTTTCTVPPLAEGDYTVKMAGKADRTLQVRATGAAQCTLPAPGTPITDAGSGDAL